MCKILLTQKSSIFGLILKMFRAISPLPPPEAQSSHPSKPKSMSPPWRTDFYPPPAANYRTQVWPQAIHSSYNLNRDARSQYRTCPFSDKGRPHRTFCISRAVLPIVLFGERGETQESQLETAPPPIFLQPMHISIL